MSEKIMLKMGDIMLKGKNKKRIIDAFVNHIDDVLNSDGVEIERKHDRFYLHYSKENTPIIVEKLKTISGLKSYTFVHSTTHDIEAMLTTIKSMIGMNHSHVQTFKVDTKRQNKRFPITSMELSKKIGGMLLDTYPQWRVDVIEPQWTIHIEIRQTHTDIYLNKIPLMGGFPVGMLGKGLLLMSGGLDSPVAGFLSMKQGIALEIMHFESTPMTSIEASQKVVSITKKLAPYALKQTIQVHMVPFKTLHQAILEFVPEDYSITIMRRMMLRIASRYVMQHHIPVVITGESVGQVASQTLESMHVINAVTNVPIIRPLATYDKNDIMTIAKAIDTYDLSIQPFADCCSIYVPKKPATKPRTMYANRYERLFDYNHLVDEAINQMITLHIQPTSDIQLDALGITVQEALKGED